jgi:7-keto-8-aminopelargonate synthetase-like enzyme/predicted N-acyltransferase
MAALPVLIQSEDAMILDHQVHASVNNGAQLLRPRGAHYEMIRHNRLDLLEERLQELGKRHRQVWYMIDGVFSMYGDCAPMKDLYDLLEKYPQLRLYVDDAHGLSWTGEWGRGYALSEVPLHERMIVSTSMAKGFGTGGGILAFPDEEQARKVRTCGSSLVFSGPIQPPMLGACVSSARLHLTDELHERQRDLKSKISYCNELIKNAELPLIAESETPVFFIGVGLPRVGYNMIKRLMKEGYYLNLGIYPGVPVKCTGLRFSLNCNITYEDIEDLVDKITYHLPLALQDEQLGFNDIYRAFKLPLIPKEQDLQVEYPGKRRGLKLQHFTSITEIDQDKWDDMLGNEGSFDREGLRFLENTFSGNPEPENNWNFHYYIIHDKYNNPVLATFFTDLLNKDDLLAPDSVSREIELFRQNDSYYFTSRVMMMGSLLTEGKHLYVDKANNDWRHALSYLLKNVEQQQERNGATMLQLRDFDKEDEEIRDFFIEEGFFKVDMPYSHVVDFLGWQDDEDYLRRIKRKKRKFIRKEVFPLRPYYEIDYPNKATSERIDYWYKLYQNVKNTNYSINTFELPRQLLTNIVNHPDWDIIELWLKPEVDTREERLPVAVVFSYRSIHNYCPMFMGLDYDFLYDYKVYRQSVYQTIERANNLCAKRVYLGLGASLEKRKFGAKKVPKVTYLQSDDNYKLEVLGLMQIQEE